MQQIDVPSAESSQGIITDLLSLSRTDTLYNDHYTQRARFFLAKELSLTDYRQHKQKVTNLASLPNQIRNAMNDGNWRKVQELSRLHKTLTDLLERQQPLYELGQKLYDNQTIEIDPFSPGMSSLPGVSKHDLTDLRREVLLWLKRLSKNDPEKQLFYLQRATTFEALTIAAKETTTALHPSAKQLKADALEALEKGHFDKLGLLAQNLAEAPVVSDGGSELDTRGFDSDDTTADLHFEFSAKVIENAAKLGFELLHVPSRHREFAPFCQFAWYPTFAPVEEEHDGVLRLPGIDFPPDTPDALKARVQLYAMHPMVNSAGVRFLPTMVGEDVLVETFDEPESGAATPKSGLLEVLGLPHRNHLSRKQIEVALQEHGNRCLNDEIGLDPVEFRLVCIPPDLHMSIGLNRGWGQKQIWTHFDGYLVMMDGAMRPLAGGDIRYGGIYDLLGISRDYDSEHIIARFAVVQRRRMATRRG